jgi:hypothetical protein
MNPPTKSTSLQAYRMILYRRALHPELFRVKLRKTLDHAAYLFEAWLMPGSHLLRFEYDGGCATELITDQEEGIPDRGVVAAIPCAGERDHEQAFGEKIRLVSTVQTESLPESLYAATYKELVAFGKENDAMVHTWLDEDGGKCASILDLQRYRQEVHAQSYHLMAQGGLVLRTQTIFEHKE